MQGIMEWEKVREAIINNFGEQHWGRGFWNLSGSCSFICLLLLLEDTGLPFQNSPRASHP